ncbi:ABC-2 type transport system permease protein [Luteibacter rhizovicinus]|uniref:Transport permease protein n=1 Tax=Luteibacter rhizovicinus TaxID=242606 RepID=A0A4R3YR17_9GAMM|nr:ABC transporter permease [Luteibacter rhizovicinus]TCV94880.1 ABC-2 type transport system permease protein [Luteibacter rhizovicinus]
MNAIATPIAPPSMSRGRVFNAYVQEAKAECLRYLRNPGFLLPTLLFPSVFYLMFGIFLARSNGPEVPRILLAAYGVFGVMAPGLFGFGVSLALERDSGLLTLKRAMPMPPGAYLIGKMTMAMGVATVISVFLLCMALFLAHVQLSGSQIATLFVVQLLGVLPFCAMGLLIGSLIKGQGAPGLINMIYLPMAFLSGLWFPLSMLPAFIQRLAPVWPSYHLNQLALSAIGLGQGGEWGHIGVLAIYTVAFVLLAARRLRRYG